MLKFHDIQSSIDRIQCIEASLCRNSQDRISTTPYIMIEDSFNIKDFMFICRSEYDDWMPILADMLHPVPFKLEPLNDATFLR